MSLSDRVADLEREIKGLRNTAAHLRIADLERENQNLKDQVRRLEIGLRAQQERVMRLNAELGRYETNR